MQSAQPSAELRLEPVFLLTLRVFLVLAVGAVLGLYVASERTADAFAWTIEPPLTAAILGAGYTGSLVLFGMTARGGTYARMRSAIPAPFVLSIAMLITTLLHLDRFHLDRGGVPGAVAWIWLIVYVIVPPLLAFAWLRHRDHPMPRVGTTLPRWAAAVPWAGVAGAAVLGMLLMLAPSSGLAAAWPWAMTPLTARAVGSWLLAGAAAQAHIAWDGDLVRVRPLIAATTATGLFGLGALARYPDAASGPGQWIVAGMLAVLFVLGGAGLRASANGPSGMG